MQTMGKNVESLMMATCRWTVVSIMMDPPPHHYHHRRHRRRRVFRRRNRRGTPHVTCRAKGPRSAPVQGAQGQGAGLTCEKKAHPPLARGSPLKSHHSNVMSLRRIQKWAWLLSVCSCILPVRGGYTFVPVSDWNQGTRAGEFHHPGPGHC